MSQNSSDTPKKHLQRRWWMLIVLPLWVFASLLLAQTLIGGLVAILKAVHAPLYAINESVLTTTLAALMYVLTLGIVIGVPWLVKRRRVTGQDLALRAMPSWTDIWMTPVGLVVYLILSAFLIYLATNLLPWFDASQAQDTGFSQLGQRYEYILAFITLVIIAPVAEELLFRGYLFGKLLKSVPVWAAVIVTSLLFAAVHGAWNLAFDTFALSIVLCLLRLSTGSLWAPMLLHMTKNGIAFYLLFINPLLLNTLGG